MLERILKMFFAKSPPQNLALTLVLLLLHQLGLEVKHTPRELPIDDNVCVQKAHSLSSQQPVFQFQNDHT